MSRATLAGALLLFVATSALYWPATHFDFVDVDDAQFVRENPWVRQGLSAETIRWAFTESHASNWLPLTFLSLAADTSLFGHDPGPYHRTNLLLHALAALLLFLALRSLIGDGVGAFLIAALWALHPLRVESVAWISERKDVLSGALGFASLWSYALYARGGKARHLLLCGIALALGLLAKSMLVTWPFVFLLLDLWPLRRELSWRRRLTEKAPLFVLVAAVSIATYLAQRAGGAVSTLHQLSFSQRAANAAVSVVHYVGDLFWPVDLAYLYPHPAFLAPEFGWPPLTVGLCVALLAGISIALFLLFRRGLAAPWIGWLLFLGTLVPVLGILQVGVQSRADRYTYIPHVGLILALVFGMGNLCARWPRLHRPLLATGALAVLALGLATWRQLPVWRDSEALFGHAIAVTSDNAYAQNGLGALLGQRGEFAAARPHLEEALRIDPRLADAHLNLGIVLAAQGDQQAARQHYDRAIALDPASGLAHLHVGILLAMQGQLPDAEASLLRARQFGPERWQTELNLALVQWALGERGEALASLRRARRLNPSHPTIRQKWQEWGADGG